MKNFRNEVQQRGEEGGNFVWILAIVWAMTLYFPDPIPLIDEIGIPLILLSSPKGRSAFLTVIVGVIVLMFIGLVPLGILA